MTGSLLGAVRPRLLPLVFWHRHDQAGPPRLKPLQQAITTEFGRRGWAGVEPLRWAITAVEQERGLRIEAIGLLTDPAAGREGG